MQNLGRVQTRLSLELFHVQTNTNFELPPNLAVIRIGKPNDQIEPDVDTTHLPDADFVSRIHAEIQVEGSTYYLVDMVSANGTYLNDAKLEPGNRYPLNLGDRIDLGQGNKVTFRFQSKQLIQHQQTVISTANATVLQPQMTENAGKSPQVDRLSKHVGLVLMVAGIVILTANTHVGIFFRIPGVLLSVAGVVVLTWRRAYRNLGWILIALGIAIILFTGNVFASVSLFTILISSVLFVAGYQLFSSGKILKYDLRSLKGLLKK